MSTESFKNQIAEKLRQYKESNAIDMVEMDIKYKVLRNFTQDYYIDSRYKILNSAIEKFKRKNYVDVNQITDFLGVKIVVKNIESAFKIGEMFKQKYRVLSQNNYYINPKGDGYKAFHLDVNVGEYRIELQIKDVKNEIKHLLSHDNIYKYPIANQVKDSLSLMFYEKIDYILKDQDINPKQADLYKSSIATDDIINTIVKDMVVNIYKFEIKNIEYVDSKTAKSLLSFSDKILTYKDINNIYSNLKHSDAIKDTNSEIFKKYSDLKSIIKNIESLTKNKIISQYEKEFPAIQYISDKTAKYIDGLNDKDGFRTISEIKNLYKTRPDSQNFPHDIYADIKHSQLKFKNESAELKTSHIKDIEL